MFCNKPVNPPKPLHHHDDCMSDCLDDYCHYEEPHRPICDNHAHHMNHTWVHGHHDHHEMHRPMMPQVHVHDKRFCERKREDHIAPVMKCENCLYFERFKINAGYCRFNPPTVLFDAEMGKVISIRPEVVEADFCSKFESK